MKCSFCSEEIREGTGVMVADKNGKVLAFDSRKCEKNMNLGRDPRKFKWTGKK
jgi:large subunit ribosomal protein L24e